jgi:hypothetical protein
MTNPITLTFHDGTFSFWAAESVKGISVFRVRVDRDPAERADEKNIIGALGPATVDEIARWMSLKDFWPIDRYGA